MHPNIPGHMSVSMHATNCRGYSYNVYVIDNSILACWYQGNCYYVEQMCLISNTWHVGIKGILIT